MSVGSSHPIVVPIRPQLPVVPDIEMGHYITHQPYPQTTSAPPTVVSQTQSPQQTKPTYPPRPQNPPPFPNQPTYPALPVPPNYPANPIPGSTGTAVGVYPPRPTDPYLTYPNFNIAISHWPYYAIPFPFAGLEQLAGGLGGIAPGATAGCGCENATVVGHQHEAGASLQIGAQVGSGFVSSQQSASINSGLNPSAPAAQNLPTIGQQQTPFVGGGIVGFIPVIFFPTAGAPCQHGVNGGGASIGFPGFPAAGPCGQCNQQQPSQLPQSAVDSLQPVLATSNQVAAGINTIIPTIGHQRRQRSRKVKSIAVN